MWKTITYMETEIEVSQDGQIKWNGKIREPHLNADGYPVVSVKTPRGWRAFNVARMVAIAYIPNPEGLAEVNHKDYNRQNFSIDNLEWISHADNVRYSTCNYPDRHGENNSNYGNHKLHERYQADPELAKQKQSRPGKQNGRYIDGRSMKV